MDEKAILNVAVGCVIAILVVRHFTNFAFNQQVKKHGGAAQLRHGGATTQTATAGMVVAGT
jgi:hypothetical protein